MVLTETLGHSTAKTVVGSNLVPHTPFLVPPTGSTCPVEHLHGLDRVSKNCLRKQTWQSSYSHMLGVSR